jgi:hypothetical protein
LLFFNKNYFFSAGCLGCTTSCQLTKLYLQFISTEIIPELSRLIRNYSEYWIFKPSSSLAQYLKANDYDLNFYFTPDKLINIIENIAEQNNMVEVGNSNLILLNDDMRKCFDSWIIHKPDLYHLCLPHIYTVNTKKVEELQRNTITCEFYVDSFTDIIYEDPTSLFWIHPVINSVVFNMKKLTYSWKELCEVFLDFTTSQNSHIKQLNKSMFYVKPDSPLAHQFQFKHFDKSQIPLILKQITKFLGKSNNLLSLCDNLCFSYNSPLTKVSNFIEDIIQINNNLMPHIPSVVYI